MQSSEWIIKRTQGISKGNNGDDGDDCNDDKDDLNVEHVPFGEMKLMCFLPSLNKVYLFNWFIKFLIS